MAITRCTSVRNVSRARKIRGCALCRGKVAVLESTDLVPVMQGMQQQPGTGGVSEAAGVRTRVWSGYVATSDCVRPAMVRLACLPY